MKIFSLLMSGFLALALLACRSNPQLREEAYLSLPTLPEVGYKQADLHKIEWLAGAWTVREAGRNMRMVFQFHDDNTLEIFEFDRKNGSTASLLRWEDGRYYFGSNSQWVLTWIGEKDIRLDPAVQGVDAMTWTRLNDHQWHLIRHTALGDEATMLERSEEMQP